MTSPDDHDLTRLLSALADRGSRSTEAVSLARRLGAQDLLFLLPDPDLGSLLPAPGFRQTLPGGATWRDLLARCDQAGTFRTTVAHPDIAHLEPAEVCVTPEGTVIVLIGGEPRRSVTDLREAAALLVALMQSEAREEAAAVKARAAGDLTRRATALAATLDSARAQLASNARALKSALSDAAQANRELRLLNETLEHRVQTEIAERMKAEEALRHAQKMEAMGQLTGGVAHDFNNLLSPIIGGLDMLLRRGVGNERERKLMDGALQSAERAKVLVQQLLAFARRQPLQPSPVDLKRLVREMAHLVSSTLGPRVDVRVELTDDLPSVIADANQLEMALLNLAVNARDAMPDGGVLTISAGPESVTGLQDSSLQAGDYVRVSVTDTGTGMSQETLARAIEPFFSTKGVGKGTGLGLSMVHGLARQLNGDLAIQSTPGAGTSINLWLPVSLVDASDDRGSTDEEPLPKAAGTVLLVDDEDLVRMSTAAMLVDLGYHVVEAGSAEEALELIAAGLHPGVVITDHLMPGMNGAEFARTLRLDDANLPVLIVSGYAEAEGLEPGLPLLNKPFRNAELAASLLALDDANHGPRLRRTRKRVD